MGILSRREFLCGVLGSTYCVTAQAEEIENQIDQEVLGFTRTGQVSWTVFGSGGTHSVDTLGAVEERRLTWTGAETGPCKGRRPRTPYQSYCDYIEKVVVSAPSLTWNDDDGRRFRGSGVSVTQALVGRAGQDCSGPVHATNVSMSTTGVFLIRRPEVGRVVVYAQLAGKAYEIASQLPVKIQIYNASDNNKLLLTEDMSAGTWIDLKDRFDAVVSSGATYRVETFSEVAFTTTDLAPKMSAHRYNMFILREADIAGD